jgi:hypothetical protein
MSLKTDLKALQKQIAALRPPDGDLGTELMRDVAEFQRFDRWLASVGHENDPHGALRAGLCTPAGFQITLEDAASSDEHCLIYHWFAFWRLLFDARDRDQADIARKIAGYRAQLLSWGIDVEAALQMARSMVCDRRTGGNVMADDEFVRIATLIRESETKRTNQGV